MRCVAAAMAGIAESRSRTGRVSISKNSSSARATSRPKASAESLSATRLTVNPPEPSVSTYQHSLLDIGILGRVGLTADAKVGDDTAHVDDDR